VSDPLADVANPLTSEDLYRLAGILDEAAHAATTAHLDSNAAPALADRVEMALNILAEELLGD
jgi:hypothetical protein